MSLDDRNAELNKRLQANPIDETISALVRADQRNRRHIVLLTISLIFDLLLSVVLAFGWHSNHNLAIKAESNHDAIIRNCQTSNESRSKNKELWTYILSLPPSNNGQASTPEQQKRLDDFKTFLDNTFAPRDCQAELKN